MATTKKAKPKSRPKAPKVSEEAAQKILDSDMMPAPGRRSKPTKGDTGAHLKNMVRFREMDIDADLAKWIRNVTRRGKLGSDTTTVIAMLHYIHSHAKGTGLGWFVPQLKRFAK